ncbi:MAG: hypothetical protein ACUZ8N_10825 [Candidatus Scalindua sp.]
MGKTTYNKLKEMLESLKIRKGTLISIDLLLKEIRKHIGNDPRTRQGAVGLMRETELIKETEDGIEIK